MTTPSWALEALSNARPAAFWPHQPGAPEEGTPLRGRSTADLVVVGGGFTGLWTAIQALEDDPQLSVLVLEAEVCGFGASTRNGGFCDSSLTHGLFNGLSHWPDEMPTLNRLGRENLDGIEATLQRHDIDADFHRRGEISVATEQWQVDELTEGATEFARAGDDFELLDSAGVRALVDSPTYMGGLVIRRDSALVDPAKLVWGLRSAAEDLGATFHDRSKVTGISAEGNSLVVSTANGSVTTDRVVVATNAYNPPVRRIRRHVIPVYDHVLMTEPLSADQMASIGWSGREGVGDASNQFHYYRLSADDRILWGGYDASYHFNNGVDPKFENSDTIHKMLSEHFFTTFPQLEGLRFTHRWAGPIATTSRFTATWGTSFKGRLAWAVGYTGLGVGASRFGARVALDIVQGRSTERTQLAMVRKKPFPFPPEPLRWGAVAVTRKAIQNADANQGRRGPWLKLLDRFGIGFDS